MTHSRKSAKKWPTIPHQCQRYILALLEVDKLPIELFYEIMGPEDINPVVVRQWQELILRRSGTFDPIFAPWHSLSLLTSKEFPAKAPAHSALTTDAAHPLNPKIARAIATTQPTMRDVALAMAMFSKKRTRLASAQEIRSESNRPCRSALEQLRHLLYGPESPAVVPPGSFADIEFSSTKAAASNL